MLKVWFWDLKKKVDIVRKKTNKEVIEKYSEKIDDLSEEAINMETRQSCTEINISNFDRETREKIQLLKMSFQNI